MRLSCAFIVLLLMVSLVRAGIQSRGQSPIVENGPRRLEVGPGKSFSLPSKAASAVSDGDIVEISGTTYVGDAAVWKANNLTLRGVGGRPHLKAGGASAQGKAIWVIQGNNTTIENIEFSGARVPDHNGAAIRSEGLGLIIRSCYIHDNEDGILAANPNADVLIEGSELSGSYGPYNHNIYIGNIHKFTLQFSYVHDATEGHNVKTRAQTNFILYNRIMDEGNGRSSYAVDIPNGGRSYLIGNLIQKGPNAQNPNVISYAVEAATNMLQELYLVNNTIISDFRRGSFLSVMGTPSAVSIINNIFVGQGVTLPKVGGMDHNLLSLDPQFQNSFKFDYRLRSGSPAIDRGINPGIAADFDVAPRFEYVHPVSHQIRTNIGPIDIGAFEYVGPQ